jgi:hypothetical protein
MSSERTIVDIGRFLEGSGLRVRQHSAFGGVTPGAHAPGGYHPHDEAIDVTDWRDEIIGGQDWRQRTKGMRDRFAQLGLNEVLGPGDAGHGTHLHLALRGKLALSDQQLQWARDGRYQDASGAWQTSLPAPLQPAPTGAGATGSGPTGPGATGSAPARPEPAKPQPMDWRPAASDSGRSTDPASQAYWQRQDMKLWAQANPALAKATMARVGADASWLDTPAMQPPVPQAPAAQAPAAQTPAPPKPENRGALSGTQVGAPPAAVWDAPAAADATSTWAKARELAQRFSLYTGDPL